MSGEDVIVLLGAGASCEAGLAPSQKMMERLESDLRLGGKWSDYEKLYIAVKSAILYGRALEGKSLNELNIEEFVNVLNELVQCKKHTIYPFIASWNMELMEYAGKNFVNIRKFKSEIVKELVSDWIFLCNVSNAEYYKGLLEFAKSFAKLLRVFSLNYDLCVECGCGKENVYRGFELDEHGMKVWDDRNFQKEQINEPLVLYKLHGSVDWSRDSLGRLVYDDYFNPSKDADSYEMIFGTSNKMRYEDPYLYYLSVFRKYALEAKLIISIGYSFNDKHINKIIEQSARRKLASIVHVTAPLANKEEETTLILERLRLPSSSKVAIDVYPIGAKEFMLNELNVKKMAKYVPEEEGLPF